MNAAAAEALFEAERKGVKQIKALGDSFGGRCTRGVLSEHFLGTPHWFTLPMPSSRVAFVAAAGLSENLVDCPLCGMTWFREWDLLSHFNDNHGLTFAEIARKLGPDSA